MKVKMYLISAGFVSLLAVLFLHFRAAPSLAEDGAAVLKKVDKVENAMKDTVIEMKMTLVDKSGDTKERKAKVMQKGETKRIFKFLTPADIKGVGVLVLENDVIYFYMPAFGKTRRIASSAKNDTFMGTDFTFDDMGSLKYSDDYDVEKMETEEKRYILTLKPKPGKKKEYSSLKMYVNKSNFVFTRLEYYSKGEKLKKVLKKSKIKKKGKYWMAYKMVMKDVKKKHKTIMEIESAKFDTGLEDDKFSQRELKRK